MNHWKQKPSAFDFATWNSEYNIEYELDIQGYVSELMANLQAIEDDIAEEVVVSWLRTRGYRVEKEEA